MVMSRNQNAGHNHNLWNGGRIQIFRSSPYPIETPLMKKLRADLSRGMLAILRCRIFCLPRCYPKPKC
jgi:hypothetical protein